jgi:putative ABC transport system substrate-binding protein
VNRSPSPFNMLLSRDTRRRKFITLAGGAAAWPLATRAQQSPKLPTVGFMRASSRSAIDRYVAALVQRLNELGWIDGRRDRISLGGWTLRTTC